MNWSRRYKLASFLRSSLWIVPIAAIVLELMAAAVVITIEGSLHWQGIRFGLNGARAVADAVVTLSLSFIVFTFGSLLVAIQVASGQYTPRVIATTLLCDNVIRYTVGLFVFTLLFAVKALNQTEDRVPQLMILLTGLLGLVCIASFLFLIDYAARLLRPVSLVKRLGENGLAVISSVYPDPLPESQPARNGTTEFSPVQRLVYHRGAGAIVLAVNLQILVSQAEKLNGTIEFLPQVGDFVGTDDPIFLLRGGTSTFDDVSLSSCVVFGSERTMEQDPLFAFRVLVDIAIKALSKAINDPTTAVLAIDQIQRLLRRVGLRNLRTDEILGPQGKLRLIFRTPNWEDFVHLSCSEIRLYGAENFQIARRLRAMLLNLTEKLSPTRQPALRQQLQLLDRTIERCFALSEDLELARVPDSQGLGTAAHLNSTSPMDFNPLTP